MPNGQDPFSIARGPLNAQIAGTLQRPPVVPQVSPLPPRFPRVSPIPLMPSHGRGPREPGNVDLYAQPRVKNPDGTTSTVDSLSVEIDGREVLLPTVTPDGRHLRTVDDAVREFQRTGRHLGIFDSPESANAYAARLHEDYAAGKYDQTAASDPSIAVRIPNVGTVRFPASMSMDEITHESERLASGGAVAPTPSLVNRAVPMAMRIGGAVAGGIAGIPGGPPGMMALGAGGAGLGEIAAQGYEQRTGQRQAPNPTQAVVQTALGAIPAGRAIGTAPGVIAAYRAGQGALMGAGATTATELAETGELPTARQFATGTVLGGLLGGGFGRLEGRVRGARPAPVVPPEVGSIVDHPELGRVQVLAVTDDGVQVTRGGGRRWTVAADLLSPAAELPGLPAGARWQVTPDGRVVPVGTEAPPSIVSDPSFVRGVPAQYARRDVAGLLPAGRVPIVPPPPAGSVPVDPSFVRGVPAEYARREVRGSLPPGPRFVASPEGVVASVADAGALERGIAPAGGPITPSDTAEILSGRRVRSLFGMDPREAVTRGLAVIQKDERGEFAEYRVAQQAPDRSGGRSMTAAPVAYHIDPGVRRSGGSRSHSTRRIRTLSRRLSLATPSASG